MESRIQEAIEHIEQYPGTPVAGVAREFNVPRRRLQNRLEGIPPKMGYVGVNLGLTRPDGKAICHYIDPLDNLNLAVRPEFITDAADDILQTRSSKSVASNLPLVGCHWITRFIGRARPPDESISVDDQHAPYTMPAKLRPGAYLSCRLLAGNGAGGVSPHSVPRIRGQADLCGLPARQQGRRKDIY